VRAFTHWILSLFASPFGVVILGALDSTLFFSLPFGIDVAVVLLAARLHDRWWIVPVLATAGSTVGAALTFWMGEVIGEKGLDRWVPVRRLEQIRARIRRSGAVALAVLDLIPPPFPFTPFVLAAGALEVKRNTFFITLVICRLFRFGLEAVLAVVYGSSIVAWMDSDIFHDVALFFIVAAMVLTTVSLVRLARSTKPFQRRPRAAA
jgi:membrane protein YqaA with SNARE-associated domain